MSTESIDVYWPSHYGKGVKKNSEDDSEGDGEEAKQVFYIHFKATKRAGHKTRRSLMI